MAGCISCCGGGGGDAATILLPQEPDSRALPFKYALIARMMPPIHVTAETAAAMQVDFEK